MSRIFILLFIFGISYHSNAQNVDLVNDKEVQELNKLNPALTGVLNRLRFFGKCLPER